MAEHAHGKLAIVVGGGPAPGINGVISAVTIEAAHRGLEVVGIKQGFSRLIHGDTSQVVSLTHGSVGPWYNRGGSLLGTARVNPAKDQSHMDNVLAAFKTLGVKYLVTIGGDDTAYSGSQVYAKANGAIKVAHVPKTIDNDLPLPPGIPTFGFETARHLGVQLVRSLHEDARTTGRWYIIVSMGRAAGHLALGIGKAAAATLTLIREEFAGRKLTLDHICDLILGSMFKRKAEGKGYGLVVLAEGLIESVGEQGLIDGVGGEEELKKYGDIEKDEFGHLRLGEIEFGRIIREKLSKKLAALGTKTTMIDKDLGYELRCADPIPFDAEYTRDLGYGAVSFLLSPEASEYGAIVSVVGGKLTPLRFQDMIVPETMRMKTREVDVGSLTYECARKYMTRLEAEDFADAGQVKKLADAAKLTPDQFKERFEKLV